MSDGTLNLTVARGERSVWDKPGFSQTLATYDRERWVAAGIGSLLTGIGVRRRGFTGGVLAMLGTALTVRAALGWRDVQAARNCVDRAVRGRAWTDDDVVMEASDASFPASDSPAWTPTSGARTKR